MFPGGTGRDQWDEISGVSEKLISWKVGIIFSPRLQVKN